MRDDPVPGAAPLDDDQAVTRLLDEKRAVLRLIRALDVVGLDPEWARLDQPLRRLAEYDRILDVLIAQVERAGNDAKRLADLRIGQALRAGAAAIDGVFDPLTRDEAEAVERAQHRVHVEAAELWADVERVHRDLAALPPSPGRPVPTVRARSLHELDRRLVARMLHYAQEHWGPLLARARDRFELLVPDEAGETLVGSYLVYHAPMEGRLLVDRWLEREGHTLDDEDRAWVEANRAAGLSLFEVVEAEPRRSVTLRDLLRGGERIVVERTASLVMEPGMACCGRVLDFDGLSLLVGMHGNPLGVTPVLDLAEELIEALAGQGAETVPSEALLGKGAKRVLEAWCDAVEASDRASVPILTTTSGEPLRLTNDVYAVVEGRRAHVERALRRIEHVEDAEAADDDPAGATVLRKSVPGSAAWGPGGFTSHARIVVTDVEVRVFAMSVERADAMRAAIESACGASVAHRRRDVSDPREALTQRGSRGPAPAPRSDPVSTPETDALLREMKTRHYQQWLDDEIPALGGLTPRTAVRVPAMRREVEALLDGIDDLEARLPAAQRFDTAGLRRDLGLDRTERSGA